MSEQGRRNPNNWKKIPPLSIIGHETVILIIMKKIFIVPFLLMAFASIAHAADFSDVPQSHDNYLAVKYLVDEGVVKGYADGTFKPEKLVNRAEALKIILESGKVQATQEVAEMPFKDINPSDWFVKYLVKAKELGIVGGNADGTFAPGRNVARSEFLKMLLMSHNFNKEKWMGKQIFGDVPLDSWFAPYMNYAGQAGIVSSDSNGNVNPTTQLSRGEVAQIIYLMNIILKGKDTQFLLNQAESQMAQVEIYVGAGKAVQAKKSSELSVDITQQAYKNMPANNVVLGAAKLAKAYDFLVNSYVSALQKKTEESLQWGQQAITKATEAWQANNEVQPIAKHIKDRAKEIITQLPGQGAGVQ